MAVLHGVFLTLILLGEVIRRLVNSKTGTKQGKKNFDLDNLAPYPAEGIKGRAKYRTTMALKKLDQENWLTIDKNYVEQHELRDELFQTGKNKVIKCLPEARYACEEVLQEVATYLCQRYPAVFEMGANSVKITKTDEVFRLRDPANALEPLEVAARLAMEDFSILLKNEKGQNYVAATASLFPIGWCAMGRIGYTVSQMHGPVPLWHKEVEFSVNKFLARLTVDSPMERSSYFVQVTAPDEPMSSILFQPVGLSHEDIEPQPENILIRRERQTFRRLPKSGAIVFGVKTSLTPLQELPLEDLKNLVIEMRSWPDAVAKYKGRDHWEAVVVGYLESKTVSKASST
ncbi:hypothetical protein AJ79_04545 [Helicocarpus griseus UAMH5409]|uniref:DUF3445 domain-containing protein n=1 Tax=Helicocarpus griseus UAMH5409 TaxID=1447875 RepID=A0A2B7XS34_9EURO|nr:hypothetical protein AJ79_04545 [Helicocarpus griseus UAMH5409]